MRSDAPETNSRFMTVFTEWQSIPITLIALVWADKDFRKEFLQRPTAILREVLSDCPMTMTFCALENTRDTYHLVLPYRHPDTYGWSQEEAQEQLEKEIEYKTGDLEYGLPVDVIIRAFYDIPFKRRLLVTPNVALEEMGYDSKDRNYYVHENTGYTSHLILPFNKWGDDQNLSSDQLEALLIEDLKMPNLQ